MYFVTHFFTAFQVRNANSSSSFQQLSTHDCQLVANMLAQKVTILALQKKLIFQM